MVCELLLAKLLVSKRQMCKVAYLDPGVCLVHFRDRTSCEIQLWCYTKYYQGWLWAPKFRLSLDCVFSLKTVTHSVPPEVLWKTGLLAPGETAVSSIFVFHSLWGLTWAEQSVMNHTKTVSEMCGAAGTGCMLITMAACCGVRQEEPWVIPSCTQTPLPSFPFLCIW